MTAASRLVATWLLVAATVLVPVGGVGPLVAAATPGETSSEDTADDHGDTAATATSVEAPSETEGELTAGDVDYFSFTLDSGADVTVATTGDTDTTGTLEDSDGESVASDEDSGDSDNFSVTQRLAAGTYKVKVEGAESSTAGDYTLDVDSIPVVEVAVTEMPMDVESTTDDYFVLYVKHTEHSLLPVRVFRGEADETTISEVLAPLAVSEYRLDKFKVATPADVDGDGIDDITELDSLGDMNPVSRSQIKKLEAESIFHHGQVAIPDRATFVATSVTDRVIVDQSTYRVVEYGKFWVEDAFVDGFDEDDNYAKLFNENAQLYFTNSNTYVTHPLFWNAQGLDDQHNIWTRLAGELIFHPNVMAPDGRLGMYVFQMDQALQFENVEFIFELMASAMPFLENNLAYYLSESRGALAKYNEEKALYDASRINVVRFADVHADVPFVAMNEGSGYGLLQKMDPGDRPNPRDIVIYESLPNDLPRVAGIITTVPQVPLSHVNLRAIQNAVPNAFVRDALDKDHQVESLIDEHVFYEVTASGYTIRAATSEEVMAHYESLRPKETQTLERDLTETEIKSLSDVGFDDWDAFGVKAANMAELSKLGLPAGTVPVGYAIPFHFYDAFMTHNDLHDDVTKMLADEDFQSDYAEQEKQLKKLRKKINKGKTPQWIIDALTAMHANYDEDQSLRYRSSTNNEDLPGFSGAGLYDSKTQRPDETEEDGIDKSIIDVWKSLWNYRAFLEREFNRVDHTSVAMGVLVHPNFDDEKVNGVAVSWNTLHGNGNSYYVNSQAGENLVTNPDANSIPEELLLNPNGTYQILAKSNQVASGGLLLTDAQLTQLASNLTTIHNKFKQLYEIQEGEQFAIEIEFKITKDNVLAIKQARPWVFQPSLDDPGDTREGAREVQTPSTTPGDITAGDTDYFKLNVTGPGQLTITTSGTTDTTGTLEDASGTELATDTDSGDDTNFSITHEVTAGTYYVKVTGAASTTTGDYSLSIGPVVPVAELSEALQAEVNEELGRAADTVVTQYELARLTQLVANDNSDLSDLSGLENAVNLTRLELSKTSVADLSPISGLIMLHVLKLNNTSIDSVADLSVLPSLEVLWFNNTDVDDISALSSLISLRDVRMHRRVSGAAISDIAALIGLPSLELVDVRGNPLSLEMLTQIGVLNGFGVTVLIDPPADDPPNDDPPNDDPPTDDPPNDDPPNDDPPEDDPPADPVVELSEALQAEVNEELGRAAETAVTQSELAGLTQLIANDNTDLSDLSGLEHATNLTRLELSKTSVADLTAIGGLASLEVLKLNNTSIDSVEDLGALTSLEVLWFNNTDVDDITTLANLTALRDVRFHRRQSGTAITDISTLLNLTNLELVEMRGTTPDATMQTHIDTLKTNGVTVRHD